MTVSSRALGVLVCALVVFQAHGTASMTEDNSTEGPTSEMESLLHWAVTHSDPDALRQGALAAGGGAPGQKLTIEELKRLAAQRAKIREAIDAFNEEPTETQLMQEAIESITAFAKKASSLDGNEEDAEEVEYISNNLKGLQILVEPIDNANDLKNLKALSPLLSLLDGPLPLRLGAAGVIGTAASNNPTFQDHILEISDGAAIGKLLELMSREALASEGDAQTTTRYLYAVAALVRNTDRAQQAFFSAGGTPALVAALKQGTSTQSFKLINRCLQLAADLAMAQDLEQGSQIRQMLLMGEDKLAVGIAEVLSSDALPLEVVDNALRALEALSYDSAGRELLVKEPLVGQSLLAAEERLSNSLPEDQDDAEYTQDVLAECRNMRQHLGVSPEAGKDEL